MPRQSSLIPPPRKDAKLHAAALAWHKAEEERQSAKARCDEARAAVLAIMHRKGQKTYQHLDVTVEIVEREQLKIQVGEVEEE